MRFIGRRLILVSVMVLLSCTLGACQSKPTTSVSESLLQADEGNNHEVDEKQQEEPPKDSITSTIQREQLKEREYTLYVLNLGKVECTKQIKGWDQEQSSMGVIYEKMLETLVDYIGYDIEVNEVNVFSNRIQVDLHSSSDLFHREQFNESLTAPVQYSSYEDMVFGILDSMMITIQKNYGEDIAIMYTEDGEVMEFLDEGIELKLSKENIYRGWEYYNNRYQMRREEKITYLVDLGMGYNEVLLRLNDNKIETRQEEQFSMLGDHNGWETFDDVDEYLKHAWLHIILYSDSYEFVFDGPNTELMGITIYKADLPSKRGLYVGDSLKRLFELYGEEYTMYVVEGSLLYEYELGNGYFRAFVDATREYIISYGVCTYRQADLLQGQEILEKITYKEQLKK